MRQASGVIQVGTRGKGLYEITADVTKWVRTQGFSTGLLTLFCRHTSASLVIQENADPDVQTDLVNYFERIAPESRGDYVHTMEGPDDMPAHIKSAMTGVCLSIPVTAGEPLLGTWQGIYVFEHRAHPHRRSLALHIIGE